MTVLVRYDAACRALADAKNVDEVKDIRDKAIALKVYARQANNRQLESDAFEIRFRAERRLGEMMGQQPKQTGGDAMKVKARVKEKPEVPISLADAGIDKNLAHRARTLAGMSAERFEETVSDARDAVNRAVRTVVRQAEIEAENAARPPARGGTVADLHTLISAGRRFGVIYADPPWAFEVSSGKGKQKAAERHYNCLSLDAINALPIEKLAADDCALFLWGVWEETPGALDVIRSWGFEFTTLGFNWVKQNKGGDSLKMGLGYSTRSGSEACWLAKRGSPQCLAMDVRQVVVTPVGEHSVKPDAVPEGIERLYAGPYLELFARRKTGWPIRQ